MKVILIDEIGETLTDLRKGLRDIPTIEFAEVEQAVYMAPPPGLDAVFMTLPAAERWGPNFKSRKGQVLSTSLRDRERGFPPFIVTGVNLTPADPTDPLSQVRIILEEAFAAVTEHNHHKEDRITSLGFWVKTLTNGVTSGNLVELLHKTLPGLQAQ